MKPLADLTVKIFADGADLAGMHGQNLAFGMA